MLLTSHRRARHTHTHTQVGANVKDIYLERSHLKASVMTVMNTYVVEVRNQAHWNVLKDTLEKAGFAVTRTEDY
jgi:hypothetical protein